MPAPSDPVTLNPDQIEELSRKLSVLRHDVNNQISLIMAAVEIAQHKPEMTARMLSTLLEQPQRITDAMARFSAEFDKALSITRG